MTKIRKIIIIILAILSVAVVGLLFAWAMRGTSKTVTGDVPAAYYTLSAQVCDADTRTDVVTFEDGSGNLWDAYDAEEWEVGEIVELLMHNHGTQDVTDDEIIGIAHGKWYMEHN